MDCLIPIIIGSEFDINELANLLFDGDFGRKPFHTAGSVEALNTLAVLEDVGGVFGIGDGTAVAKTDDVRADGTGCGYAFVNKRHTFIKRFCGLGTNGPGSG